MINTVVLIIGSGFVLAAAIPRLLNPESSDAAGMMFLAIAGIIINGLAILRVKDSMSLSVQVVTWHLLEDVLTWTAVVDESTTKDEISQIKRELKSLTENMGLEHRTIEIEYGNHDCSMKIDTRINRHFKKS